MIIILKEEEWFMYSINGHHIRVVSFRLETVDHWIATAQKTISKIFSTI